MLSSGHLLDNRYRLDERIATGGMGDVWRGTDIVLNRVIAVKVLRTAMLADKEFSARFYGEARMMAAFRHPGVVEVYDYASATDSTDDSQCAYLVMAYVEGEPLSARLKDAGQLDVTETMSIVAQAADALHAAHENGTVHRDVKPGNLIVKPNGTVILVDFGVARSNAVTSVTGINSIVGTALYMAPEQVSKGSVSAATDIYALGAVAYHCLAGHPPFDGDNALQVALRHLEDDPPPLPGDVPQPVRDLISRAMAKKPQDRFASAADFADAALNAGGPLQLPSTTTTALVMPSHATAATRALAASTRTAAMPPGSSAAPPIAPPPAPAIGGAPGRRRDRNQFVMLATVLGLLLVAGGIAVAIALSSIGDKGTGQTTPDGVVPSADSPSDPALDETLVPTQSVTTNRQPNAPATGSPRQSASATPTATTTPTSVVTTTTPPPATTTTTPPVQATTPPATPTTPANEPTTTTPATGGGDGGGEDTANSITG